ncbi:cadherin-like beta sandwich domain-containing protein [Faecalispora anaeroviscerum]|uniref:cadherin-like beta sandwich domain-containing protein n=1 Tax=Faecalispora anaeroviscerum TaxID=2991836 RepID=UPI0024BBD0B6|nr:cadherin-like beta sandwich domain-containing protein [Faecalispora anaeroviscerum]
MKKPWLLIMIVCAALIGYPCRAFAAATEYFSAALSAQAVYPGETVRVELSANSGALAEGELPAAFRARLGYDSARLHFLRTETSDQIQSGAFQFYDDGESVTGVYACDGLSAPRLNGVCITFVFSVPEDADPGSAAITVDIDQTADWAERLLPQYDRDTQLSFSIKPALSQDASLQKLVPSTGRLRPDFSPDIAEYDLRVGSNISSVKFQADAADSGSVRVSRQSLQRAGETTEIVVTVTAADKKSKSQYLIRVNRSENPSSAEPEQSAKPAASSTPEKQSTGKQTAEKTSSAQKSKEDATSRATGRSSSKASSSKTSSKASTKASDKNHSSPAASDPGTAAETQAVQTAGTRNLYLVGGQTDSLPIWILACCVMVLTALTAWNAWKSREKK